MPAQSQTEMISSQGRRKIITLNIDLSITGEEREREGEGEGWQESRRGHAIFKYEPGKWRNLLSGSYLQLLSAAALIQ